MGSHSRVLGGPHSCIVLGMVLFLDNIWEAPQHPSILPRNRSSPCWADLGSWALGHHQPGPRAAWGQQCQPGTPGPSADPNTSWRPQSQGEPQHHWDPPGHPAPLGPHCSAAVGLILWLGRVLSSRAVTAALTMSNEGSRGLAAVPERLLNGEEKKRMESYKLTLSLRSRREWE